MTNLAQTIWRCRRGNKELDLMLSAYLDKQYPGASKAERIAFNELLDLSDPEIWLLITGLNQTENSILKKVIEKIRAFPAI